MSRWQPDDAWEEHRNALAALRSAHALAGIVPPGPPDADHHDHVMPPWHGAHECGRCRHRFVARRELEAHRCHGGAA